MKTAKFLSILILTIVLGSCQNPFRPELRDISSATITNSNPQELLHNLEKAYQEKNINIYKQLLHKDYRFELIQSETSSIGVDMDGDGIRDSWWGLDEEIELTRNMFERGSSDGTMPVADDIDLRLQIPPQENWEIDPADGHEHWIVIPCYFDLTLTYFSSNSSYVANGVARFYLVEEAGSWYIRIWRDESLL
ncbi:MAG: hypothetical protein PHS23_01585 [Candidatus Cloacimonetes bacterium]|nr:hypothetical protein [Candidatus Cloacimonadota bacterium]HPF08715.1 hypothetical protein [Candidatus Cloacimonadota bacterium]